MNSTAADGLGGLGISSLTDFVLKAVQLGFLGFGAALFVMVFIILFRNQKPADASTAKLRMRFLTFGVAAFAFAGISQLVAPLIAPAPSRAYKLSVTFAPQLDVNKLPEPSMIVLPANVKIAQNAPFDVKQDATLAIGIDGILQQVRSLKNTTDALSASNQELSSQVVKAALDTRECANIPVDAAKQIGELSAEVRKNVTMGEILRAENGSRQLNMIVKSTDIFR